MPTISAPALNQLARDLLTAVETDPAAAQVVADSLTNANLAGHDSHGVLRLVGYLEGVRRGHVLPTATPELLSQSGATAIVDGAYGWGQPAMWLATRAAIERAREFGLGAAVVHRCYHIGRVAPYVEAIAGEGMVGLAMANAAPAVAPYGGRGRVMGTNPIAWAVPRAEGKPPISLDVATAGIAEGKLRVARARGATVPAGNVVDRNGLATVTPSDFYDGGALLAFGAHKGSGFSLLAQFIGRGLAGMDPTAYDGPRGVNGPFILVIDVARFTEPDRFRAEIEAQSEVVTGCPPADGFASVMLPGEPELLTRAARERDGVPVAESTWQELVELAEHYGVEAPVPSTP